MIVKFLFGILFLQTQMNKNASLGLFCGRIAEADKGYGKSMAQRGWPFVAIMQSEVEELVVTARIVLRGRGLIQVDAAAVV